MNRAHTHPPAHAKVRRRGLAGLLPPLLVAFALWGIFFHGLPSRMTRSIPHTAYHQGEIETAGLVPGDHLQLLYHFWLTREKLTGRTPLLYNVYEFNTGDDEARGEADPGYIPFSLVYACVTEAGGSHALGWNLAQLGAVLTAFLFLYGLARRYVGSRTLALAAAALAASLPYQWMNLGGGSPTGFGMAFVPAVALGVDLAVREGRARGGLLAGVALLFCYTSDLHCLAFACMLIPAWAVVAWFSRTDCLRPTRQGMREAARGLWPTLVAGLFVAGVAKMLASFYSGTDAAGGRSMLEVMRNSPSRRAMFGYVIKGVDLHFRVGFVILAAVGLAVLLVAGHAWMRRRRTASAVRPCVSWLASQSMRVAVLLAAGVGIVLLLGMGHNAPFEGLPIRIVRAVVPPYTMIRQPIKVLCLLPTLLAPLFALGLAAFLATVRGFTARRTRMNSVIRDLIHLAAGGCVALLVAAGVVETARAIRPGLCVLPAHNAGYEAVVADAAARGRTPHVLALPIWPGDSAWSSLYEYNTMLYGVRMINGYAAVCTETYLQDVYRALESVTQGRLTDEQAAMLRWRGVTAVVLYANAFPEQVSPFPVDVTVARLSKNPHLKLLSSGAELAFSLRDEPVDGLPPAPDVPPLPFVSPARRWSVGDSSAAPIASDRARAWLRSPVVWTPKLAWISRIRGGGAVEAARILAIPDADPGGAQVTVSSRVSEMTVIGGDDDYRWVSIPVGDWPEGWAQAGIELIPSPDSAVLDVLLANGDPPLGQDVLELPASAFFHGGVLDLGEGGGMGVRFRAGRDPADEILYGLHLPLDPGLWRFSLEGDFPQGDIGALRILDGGEERARGRVGRNAPPVESRVRNWAPVTLRFRYAGTEDCLVRLIRMERVGD